MNTIYRSIWNKKTGTLVAVSENAKSTGKSSSDGTIVVRAKLLLCISALSVAVMLAFGANAHAQPVGVLWWGDRTDSAKHKFNHHQPDHTKHSDQLAKL